MKCNQPVKVNGKYFPSISAAAKSLNTYPANIKWAMTHSKQFRGISIEPSYTKGPLERKYIQSCKVYCETTNTTFPTIAAAAKEAQVNSWTMSIKMQTAGSFVDKNGNVYKRLSPMKSRRTYKDTGNTIQKIRTCKKKDSEYTPVMAEMPFLSGARTEVVETPEEDQARAYIKEAIKALLEKDEFETIQHLITALQSYKG